MNLSRIMPVSFMLEGEYGIRDAALSLPAIIGEKGVARVLTPELTQEEKETLVHSARLIAAAVKGAAA
jgi:malate/lactate dehydrogenase